MEGTDTAADKDEGSKANAWLRERGTYTYSKSPVKAFERENICHFCWMGALLQWRDFMLRWVLFFRNIFNACPT